MTAYAVYTLTNLQWIAEVFPTNQKAIAHFVKSAYSVREVTGRFFFSFLCHVQAGFDSASFAFVLDHNGGAHKFDEHARWAKLAKVYV